MTPAQPLATPATPTQAPTQLTESAQTSRSSLPWLRRQVLARLAGLARGRLRLVEVDGSGEEREFLFGREAAGEAEDLSVTVRVLDPRFYSRIALGGSVGAGESYMAGEWQTDDLTAVVRLMVRNRSALESLDTGWARLKRPLRRLGHWLRRNTRRGSRRNIEAHYDLGNDFFGQFLDETLMYSCAIFETPDASLADASRAKLRRLCEKLRLQPEDHVLEIGTGWGGFAEFAASHYGCRVTTTTISPAQFEHARARLAAAGLGERVEVLLEDYRDLRGRYDKVVSIEMIEAVGHRFLDTFFGQCGRLLAPQGLMALQAITIDDRLYKPALSAVDFIQRHIFPGSFIPSVGVLTASIGRATDLTLVHLEDIGLHYARTLRSWRERFLANAEEIRRLGFPESFLRMWEYYFSYCEGGFLERSIGDVQMVLAGPLNRQQPLLGRL